jgi:putative membrane protein
MPVVLGATLTMAGCKGDDPQNTPYASDSAAMASGAAADSQSTVTPPPADTAPAALTDANIFAKLDLANQEEVDEGKLGSEKAASAAVKKFAKMLMTDHGKMQAEGAALAKRLNIAPQLPAGDTSASAVQHTMDMLNAATGASFDSLYLAVQVAGHQRTLDELGRMGSLAASDSLKTLISGAIPVVQRHLDEARALQTKR